MPRYATPYRVTLLDNAMNIHSCLRCLIIMHDCYTDAILRLKAIYEAIGRSDANSRLDAKCSKIRFYAIVYDHSLIPIIVYHYTYLDVIIRKKTIMIITIKINLIKNKQAMLFNGIV